MRWGRVVGGILIVLVTMVWAPVLAATDKPVDPAKSTVNLELKDVSIKDAIEALFKGTGIKYYIQPGVSGKIAELRLTGISLDQALKSIVDATDLTYEVKDGAYIIGPAKKTTTQAGVGAGAKPETGQNLVSVEPEATLPAPQFPEGDLPPAVVPSTTQVIVTPPAPVYYGQPAPPIEAYGYNPYPSVLQFGNVSVISRFPPIYVGGGGRIFFQRAFRPPIPGWVSPDAERFLRNQYIIAPRPSYEY